MCLNKLTAILINTKSRGQGSRYYSVESHTLCEMCVHRASQLYRLCVMIFTLTQSNHNNKSNLRKKASNHSLKNTHKHASMHIYTHAYCRALANTHTHTHTHTHTNTYEYLLCKSILFQKPLFGVVTNDVSRPTMQ